MGVWRLSYDEKYRVLKLLTQYYSDIEIDYRRLAIFLSPSYNTVVRLRTKQFFLIIVSNDRNHSPISSVPRKNT